MKSSKRLICGINEATGITDDGYFLAMVNGRAYSDDVPSWRRYHHSANYLKHFCLDNH